MSVSSSPSSSSPLPEGLKLPDMIITRRTRTQSMSGRIQDQVHQGKVKFFCRSKGHGFIDPSKVMNYLARGMIEGLDVLDGQLKLSKEGMKSLETLLVSGLSLNVDIDFKITTKGGSPMFMHISDIEGELIPRKGDTVKFRMCPMPPKFDKFQAVHIEIVDFVPEIHHKWSEKETPEESFITPMYVEKEKEREREGARPSR
eukprot:TCALIF_11283-PA protein Name:"Similar to CG9705 Cold shock domain-containing protein CG9705 (Drosophila melanogaster)" AED:0.17 eAED:0.17 QI:0/0/0/0.66/1/1/3/0/200